MHPFAVLQAICVFSEVFLVVSDIVITVLLLSSLDNLAVNLEGIQRRSVLSIAHDGVGATLRSG